VSSTPPAAQAPSRGARLEPWTLAPGALVLALDYAFKRFAAHASASELDFLLGPTTALVRGVTGHDFVAERGAGYISREAHVIIAPACSGANFAIVLFTALGLGFLGRFSRRRARLGWLLVAAALAYAATLLANAARISLALTLERSHVLAFWFPAAAVHRAVGVAVYLVALLALHAALARILGQRRFDARLPLACYVLVTFATPLLGGAPLGPKFFSHAAVVLGATTLAGAVLWLLGDWRTRRDERGSAHARVPRRVARARCGGERALPRQGDAALVPRPVA